ncbi:hypothetical protein LCGC14_2864370 [marine sediment metagenome]|uniref:AP2-like integrase N-terminal domain-containing protein n=1 Tax=marine sediment metagenome TaxID=412755 RepID=A0A0F8Y4Q1_9ZZZZ
MAFLISRDGVWYVKFKRYGRWHRHSLRTRNKRQAEAELKAIEAGLAKEEAFGATKRSGDGLSLDALWERYAKWAKTHRAIL